jgi:hypothetical protein
MKWSLLGEYKKEAKSSFFGMALAVIVAMETFGNHGSRYKVWTSFLIIAAGCYLALKARDKRSILGIATGFFSLVWVLPIVSSTVFYSVDGWFMLSHSIFSLAVAVGAFTYLKS